MKAKIWNKGSSSTSDQIMIKKLTPKPKLELGLKLKKTVIQLAPASHMSHHFSELNTNIEDYTDLTELKVEPGLRPTRTKSKPKPN